MKKTLRNVLAVLLLLFLPGTPILAQTSRLDSLEKVLASLPQSKAGKPDTNRIKLINKISLICKTTGENQKGHTYCNAVIATYADSANRTHRDSFFLGEAYVNKGMIYGRQGLNDSAVAMYETALKIFEGCDDPWGVSMVYGNLSTVYMSKSDYPKSLEYIFKAITIREKIGDKQAVASIYGNAGEVYRYMGDTMRALQYHRYSLRISDSLSLLQPGNLELINFRGNALNNIGLIFDERGMFKEALPYHLKSLELRTSVGDRSSMGASLNNIAVDFKDLGEYDSAMYYFQKSLALKKAAGDQRGLAICYLNIGEMYRLQKSFPAAKSSLDSAYKYCSILKNAFFEIELYKTYSDYYSDINQPAEAFTWYKRFIHVRDSLKSDENSRAFLRAEMDYTYAQKATKDSMQLAAKQELDNLANAEAIRRQKLYTIGGVIAFLLAAIVAFISFRAFRQKQHANEIISEQKALVEEKQKEILDSINYAKKIQLTLLAHDTLLQENLPEHFVLFLPKDIVSGDFYWATKTEDSFYLAVCDSTGHGVPGAFMSLLNISFLNEAINEKGITTPDAILNHVRSRLISSVSKDGAQDGMDGTLFRFNLQSKEITYASAYNVPVIVTSHEASTLSADKMPIGIGPKTATFSLHHLEKTGSSMLYLYTDGYADQFGGPKGKKFKYAKLNKLLGEIATLPAEQQASNLREAFYNWKGSLEQVDDVCMIGIRIT